MQYVEARGWTFSSKRKLNYWQINKIIFRKAPGRSAELQVGLNCMVQRLYSIIENDGLKVPTLGNLP